VVSSIKALGFDANLNVAAEDESESAQNLKKSIFGKVENVFIFTKAPAAGNAWRCFSNNMTYFINTHSIAFSCNVLWDD
jgi:hypothetical protein